MLSIGDIINDSVAASDGFDSEIGRQIAEDIACNRAGRLSERQKAVFRQRNIENITQDRHDALPQRSQSWRVSVAVIVAAVCFVLLSALDVVPFLGIVLAVMIGAVSVAGIQQVVRKYMPLILSWDSLTLSCNHNGCGSWHQE